MLLFVALIHLIYDSCHQILEGIFNLSSVKIPLVEKKFVPLHITLSRYSINNGKPRYKIYRSFCGYWWN